MNRFQVFCLGSLLISVCADASARNPKSGNGLPPPRETIEFRTWPYKGHFGKFEGGGKLFYQDTDPWWMGADIYYARGSRVGILLKNDPSSINVFFAAEIRRPQTARTFVKDHLVMFVMENFGDFRSAVIDEHTERSWPELKPLVLPSRPVVTGNAWTLELNVLTSRGAIQHWSFKGQVFPLCIDGFQCEIRKPNGTYDPPVFMQ